MADITIDHAGHDHAHGHPSEAEQNENRKFGIWLYLASEVVLFMMLIVGFAVFRANQPVAVNLVKNSLGILLVTANTFILLASSYAMVMGLRAINLGNREGFYRWIGLTALLGTVFVGGQYIEYSELGHLNIVLDRQDFTVATTLFEEVNEVEALVTENTLAEDGTVLDSTETVYDLREASIPADTPAENIHYVVDFADEGSAAARVFEGVDLANFDVPWVENYTLLNEAGDAAITEAREIENALIAYNDGLQQRNIPLNRLAVTDTDGNLVAFDAIMKGQAVELNQAQYDSLNTYFQKLLADSAANYGARFYAPTAFHGAHVIVGVLWALLILWRGYRGYYDQNAIGVEMFGLYWHFVDVVWIALFTLIYLI